MGEPWGHKGTGSRTSWDMRSAAACPHETRQGHRVQYGQGSRGLWGLRGGVRLLWTGRAPGAETCVLAEGLQIFLFCQDVLLVRHRWMLGPLQCMARGYTSTEGPLQGSGMCLVLCTRRCKAQVTAAQMLDGAHQGASTSQLQA